MFALLCRIALYPQGAQCKFTYCSRSLWPWKVGSRSQLHHETWGVGTHISPPCSPHQPDGSLTPEHALFALQALAQVVSGGSSSGPTDPTRTKISHLANSWCFLLDHPIPMGSAKPKVCPGSSQILIQYQSSDTVYNDQSMIRYLNSLYAIQGTVMVPGLQWWSQMEVAPYISWCATRNFH